MISISFMRPFRVVTFIKKYNLCERAMQITIQMLVILPGLEK